MNDPQVEIQSGRWFCVFCGNSNMITTKIKSNELEVSNLAGNSRLVASGQLEDDLEVYYGM